MAEQAYELVIKGGRLIDPANGIDKLCDVAVKDGKIAKVNENIPASDGKEVFDADGCIVTPGLIDSHVHCYEFATPLGINPDKDCLGRGVTTIVDCGSAGAFTFPGLRRYVADKSKTRVLCLLHIASHGLAAAGCDDLCFGECDSINQVNKALAEACIEKNRDMIVGVKVRLTASIANNGKNEDEAFRRALEVAEKCNMPLMAHHIMSTVPVESTVGQLSCPGSLRPGDIHTHTYHGFVSSVVDPKTGELHLSAVDAQTRGVLFDIGHGQDSFSWTVAEQCAKQNFWPDIVSSDLHIGNVRGPAYDLPTVMTKLLHLGMPIGDIIKATTATPAKAFGRVDELGSLAVGRVADITVLRIKSVDIDVEDSQSQIRRVKQHIVPFAVWRSGVGHEITEPEPFPNPATMKEQANAWSMLVVRDPNPPNSMVQSN